VTAYGSQSQGLGRAYLDKKCKIFWPGAKNNFNGRKIDKKH
jgi:hypothetical protein